MRRRARSRGEAQRGAFSSLGHREFALFWSSGLVSNIGTFMQVTAVPYAVDRLTHSTAAVGMAVFLSFFPGLCVGPLAGSLADRCSRRNILLWTQVVMMLAAFALWGSWELGQRTMVNLLAVVVVSSVASGIMNPSWFSLAPQLVPQEDALNAVRLNVVQLQASRAVGPALAGLVIAVLGIGPAFLVNAVSFLVVIGALLAISDRPPPSRQAGAESSSGSFMEGVRYVRRRTVLVASILTVTVLAFFGSSATQLLEPFARHVLDVGVGKYGLLVSGYGVGALIGSVLSVYVGGIRRSTVVCWSASVGALFQLGFALAPTYWFALAAVVAWGTAAILCHSTVQAVVQANVDEAHRGRVTAMYLMTFSAGMPLGALLVGALGESVGLRAIFAVCAGCLGAFVLIGSARYDRFRGFDESLPPTPLEVHPSNEAAERTLERPAS